MLNADAAGPSSKAGGGGRIPEYSPAELVQKWEEFFDAFDYAGRILSVADAYPETRTLEVRFDEVNRFDTDFAIHFLHHPQASLVAGEEAVTRIAPPGDAPIKVHLRVTGLPRDTRILVRNLRAMHLGRFITVEGLVRKATEVRPKVVDATFQCLRCSAVIKEPQEGQAFREPLECYEDQGGCSRSAASTKFKLIGEASQYLDTQKIEIQEPPEILRGGQEPQRLEAYLEDDITGQITPGERVVLNGVLRSAQRGRPGARSTIFDIFIEINSVEKEEILFEELDITQEDVRLIREEAARPDIVGRIVQSIAPTLYGLEKEKEALALQLFGGVAKRMPDGTRIRGDIHALLIGDPGAGKSQLLQYMSTIAPRAVFVSGKGTSTAGLLAAAVKDEFGEGRWTLEAGAMVLGDRGLVCLHPDSEVLIDGVPRPVRALFDEAGMIQARAGGIPIEFCPVEAATEALDVDALRTRNPDVKFVVRRHYRGRILIVRLDSGLRLKLTPDHLVLDGQNICWRRIGEMTRGERLVALQRFTARHELVYILDIIPGDWIVQPSPEEKAQLRALLGRRHGTLAQSNRVYGLRRDALSGRDALRVSQLRAILRDLGLYDSWKGRPFAYGRSSSTEALRIGQFTPDLAYVLGFCYGDGYVSVSPRRASLQVAQSRVHLPYIQRFLRASKEVTQRPWGVYPRKTDRTPEGAVRKGRSYVFHKGSSVLAYLHQWLVDDDLANLLRLDDESLRGFLAGAFDADGCVSIRTSVKGETTYQNVDIEILLSDSWRANERLLYALRRFDVFAKIRPLRGVLSLQITSRTDAQRLLDVLRPHSAKVKDIPARKSNIAAHHEEIPAGPLREVLRAIRPPAAPLTDAGLSSSFHDFRGGRRKAFKGTIRRLAALLEPWMRVDQRERLESLVQSDYALDRIVDIQSEPYDGYVYDLRVPEGENFVCNGVIVHNCIDEIEKMDPRDRGSIHVAMEEQMVHISKAGITATLPSRCAVLAAANPKFGRFMPEKYIAEQFALEGPLLSRFDVIFPVQDIPEAERDRRMADHILHAHRLGEIRRTAEELGEAPAIGEEASAYTPYFAPLFLRKYVAYAKRIYPVMTPDAMDRIRDDYLAIRKQGEPPGASVPITPRQLEAYVRLAEASARARLSPLVDVEDADRAIAIIEYWLHRIATEGGTGLGPLDIDVVTTGVPASQREQMVVLRDVIVELGGTETGPGAAQEDILEIAERRGLPRDRAEAWLRKWKQEGEVYAPVEGKYRLVTRL